MMKEELKRLAEQNGISQSDLDMAVKYGAKEESLIKALEAGMSSAEFHKAAIMTRRDALRREVDRLYDELSENDPGLVALFDPESEKMLPKKMRVLRRLLDGEDAYDIGRDYLDVMEKYDPDEWKDKVGYFDGWEFDPSKFK